MARSKVTHSATAHKVATTSADAQAKIAQHPLTITPQCVGNQVIETPLHPDLLQAPPIVGYGPTPSTKYPVPPPASQLEALHDFPLW